MRDALHYYPFVEDYQISIMAYQVRSLVNYALLAAATPIAMVGRVGLEPTMFHKWGVYSALPSPLGIPTHILVEYFNGSPE